MRAPESALEALHSLLADTLAEQIKAARKPDKDGKPGTVHPQLLNQAIKFLKDNGIDAPARGNKPTQSLVEALKDLPLDEMGAA